MCYGDAGWSLVFKNSALEEQAHVGGKQFQCFHLDLGGTCVFRLPDIGHHGRAG